MKVALKDLKAKRIFDHSFQKVIEKYLFAPCWTAFRKSCLKKCETSATGLTFSFQA